MSASCSTSSSRAKRSRSRAGKEVARLVPARPVRSRDQAREALQRMRARAEQRQLGRFDWNEWKAYRDEGRR
jgi:antitoxin (DNA-binding transcriptional repressor) of toxin-antitoxin stability system